MAVKLSAAQKDELRRLTQFANRRILAVAREYKYEGKDVLPRELVGDLQIKEKWHTSKTPLSRSVKFDNDKDYRRQLNKLRSFMNEKDDIWTYNKVQRTKTLQAIENTLGKEVPPDLANKVNSLSAPALANFWEKFSDKASKLGLAYSSGVAMQNTMQEFFPEDLTGLSSSMTKGG